MSTLLCVGLGYAARAVARRADKLGWTIAGTATTADGAARLSAEGVAAARFDGLGPAPGLAGLISRATHLLVSAPPSADGDPLLRHHAGDLIAAPLLEAIAYLSTIGVYGDQEGRWIDETTPPAPGSERSRQRLAAETGWLNALGGTGRRVMILRLPGIYGPGRSAIETVRAGTARAIVKPGQVFNRAHVEDIAAAVLAGLSGRGRHFVYNVVDDEPAPPQDVIAFAADLLGLPRPPEIAFADAALSPMAASFYAESKRVRNDRIKQDLGVSLAYPTYREGLRAIAGS